MPRPTATKESARAIVAELVQKFNDDYHHYKSPAYSEAQLRIDFLNPLFEALGWDVSNQQKRARALREVVTEDRVRVGRHLKAPDYGFQLDGRLRFFVEAKKPSVNLRDDASPARQVRTYAWNASLPISFLTDFEELAVYDCRQNPKIADLATVARLEYLTYEQYLDRFDYLWDTLSHEAVTGGALDALAATVPARRGTLTVDRAFLATLENLRQALAEGLMQANPALDADALRYLVQMLLDRIIFLRIAEDRGVEPYGELERLAADRKRETPYQLYGELLDVFRRASARYNSGLFDLRSDTLSASVKLSNAVLRPLLRELYFPQSNYKFDYIGVDILGSAYERFLGKVIQVPAPGKAVITEKPEVRKAGGVYYTPPYIVRYIVQATLGPLCEGRTPVEVAQLRILDPACGSGSFLLGAYDFLLDWHLTYYQQHKTAAPPPLAGQPAPASRRGAAARAMTSDGRLSTTTRKAILLNNLYGVDLDAQAVEVTKLSLLIKCLEGETHDSAVQQLGVERLLPTIDDNVKVGNSLVDADFYDEFEENPEQPVRPFAWRDEFRAVFKQGGFDAVIGNPPYVQLTQLPGDIVTYCRKHYTLTNDLYSLFIERAVRSLIKLNGKLSFIVPSLFLKGVAYQRVRAFINTELSTFNVVEYGDRVFEGVQMPTCVFVGFTGSHAAKNQNFFANDGALLFANDKREKVELSTVANVKRGLEIGRSSLLDKGKHICLTGGSIGRYELKYIKYITEATRREFDKGKDMFASPKIMIRETGSHFFATLDYESVITTRSIYSIRVNPTYKKLGLHEGFILAIINSKLFKYYFKQFIAPDTNIFPKVRIAQVNEIPLPKLNLKSTGDKTIHDDMVSKANDLLRLHEMQAAATVPTQQQQFKRELTQAERRLDKLVYELYGLSKPEIEQVEAAVSEA